MLDHPLTSPAAGSSPRCARILGLSVAGLTLGLVVVLGRVIQLQAAPSERLRPFIAQRISQRTEMARRGDVLDRRARVLATTRTGYRLFVDPAAIEPPYGQLVSSVAQITGLDAQAVAQRVIERVGRNEKRAAEGRSLIRYVSVGGILEPAQAEVARRLAIPGVHLELRSVREALDPALVGSLTGLVGIDHQGLVGAERAFDQRLEPEPGHLDYVRDASGRAMWVEAAGYAPANAGEDIRLSIDLELQRIASEELARGVERADAAGGRLVMIDPATGEILAMVDQVRTIPMLLEPPARGAPSGGLIAGARYRTIRPDPVRPQQPALARNRCVEEVYEPGSTFKPFMWAIVTERGLVRPDEVLQTHGGRWTTPFGRRIEDVVKVDELPWTDVLVYSSNIGMVQGTARLTHEQMRSGVLRFGFGVKTGIALSGEPAGIVTPLRRWSDYTQSSVASGYEVAVTPLQMVRAFSSFARTGQQAGTLPVLRLEAVSSSAPLSPILERVLDPQLAKLTQQQLHRVAQRMDERIFEAYPEDGPLDYSLFGKSGTAQIARPDGRGYFQDQYHSSFIAGAPLNDPRIVVLVVIDDPGPSAIAARRHYGSWVAGPVVRRVVQRALKYMGVPGDVSNRALGQITASPSTAERSITSNPSRSMVEMIAPPSSH